LAFILLKLIVLKSDVTALVIGGSGKTVKALQALHEDLVKQFGKHPSGILPNVSPAQYGVAVQVGVLRLYMSATEVSLFLLFFMLSNVIRPGHPIIRPDLTLDSTCHSTLFLIISSFYRPNNLFVVTFL
jgi:hypothetical protein